MAKRIQIALFAAASLAAGCSSGSGGGTTTAQTSTTSSAASSVGSGSTTALGSGSTTALGSGSTTASGSSTGESTNSTSGSSTGGSSGNSASGSAGAATGGSTGGVGCACPESTDGSCCAGGLCSLPSPTSGNEGQGTTGGSVAGTGGTTGGNCLAGSCERLTQLTFGASANCLAIDATHVYWSDARGAILKVPIAGGDPIAVTPCLAQAPQGIAVDSANVYFTIPDSGFVMKVDLDGGAPVAIASSEPSPFALAISSNDAYWTWSDTTFSPFGGVHFVGLDGGSVGGPFSDGSRQNDFMWDIASGPTEVGWTSTQTLNDGPEDIAQTAGLDGDVSTGVSSVLAGATTPFYGMTLDSNFAYWSQPVFIPSAPGCGGGSITAIALAGGAASVLANESFIDNPGAVIIDEGSLYWIEHGSENSTTDDAGQPVPCSSPGLYRLSLDGGSPEQLVSTPWDLTAFSAGTGRTNLGPNLCIAADSASIYWIVGGQIVKAAR
jgi:hypothetical protein